MIIHLEGCLAALESTDNRCRLWPAAVTIRRIRFGEMQEISSERRHTRCKQQSRWCKPRVDR